jgi:hypothetical protein
MSDSGEYGSLVDLVPTNLDLRAEIRRAIAEIESIRGRPLLLYAGNVIRSTAGPFAGIDQTDDLPFAELVEATPVANRDVDLLVVTPGGSGQQVSLFVNKLRQRFTNVSFLLPAQCMSAGTIWVLSGDEIWMDERAYIGPIDPQVPSRDGRWLPAQALLVLIKDIQDKGQAALAQGQQPDWAHVQILRNIDPKEIGNAISGSNYSIQLAASYLNDFKLKNWATRSKTGQAVIAAHRSSRALEIATKLCAHDVWKAHSHGISRDVAWNEVRLKIEKPETVPGLQRSMRRLWALLHWTFECTTIVKIYMSQNYAMFRQQLETKP